MRLDSGTEEASGSGDAEDPLKTKVSWMVKLQTEHRCKTGQHPPSSIGCLYLGPNQCIPFQPADLSEWAMALVSYNIGIYPTSLIHSFRLWTRLEWAWLNLLPHWTWMPQQGLIGLQTPMQVPLEMIGLDMDSPIHHGPWFHLPFLSSPNHHHSPCKLQHHFHLSYQAQTQSLKIVSLSTLQFQLGLRSLTMVLGVVQLATTSPALLKHLTRLASSPFTTSLTHTSFPMA